MTLGGGRNCSAFVGTEVSALEVAVGITEGGVDREGEGEGEGLNEVAVDSDDGTADGGVKVD